MKDSRSALAGLAALALAAVVLAPVSPARAQGETWNVPGDFPTIQAAIDAASSGAVIFVAPGVYPENIDFLGKALVVEGAGTSSVIDGGGLGPVVRFVSGEGPDSVLDSFTITGGRAATGAGIEIRDSSPTVLRNLIQDNVSSGQGSGIYVGGATAAPAIFNNLMIFNVGTPTADPHVVQVAGSAPRIVNNTIVRNDSNAVFTSGAALAEVRNNLLARNGRRRSPQGRKGRGICDFASGTIIQYNHFFRNQVSALLTAGRDFRRIRRAQEELGRPGLSDNYDARPRFSGGRIPRSLEDASPDRFIPRTDTRRPSRALNAGDPSPAYNNEDGSRNTVGHTGGPWGTEF